MFKNIDKKFLKNLQEYYLIYIQKNQVEIGYVFFMSDPLTPVIFWMNPIPLPLIPKFSAVGDGVNIPYSCCHNEGPI